MLQVSSLYHHHRYYHRHRTAPHNLGPHYGVG